MKHFNLVRPVLVVLCSVFLALSAITSAYAQQPTLSVKGPNNESVGPFRWLIEEDVNQDVVPGQTCKAPNYAGCMSLEFARSNMPVVAKGTDADPLPNLDPTKRYYISVLPNSGGVDGGYTNSGAKISAGQAAVSVTVQQLPLPTAQIRVFVFNDNYPINGQADTPEETGLAGFTITVEDTTAATPMLTDVYGNPLGTTYDSATGNVITMGDGTITTDADGIALIKNLAPGKYGISAIPPAGQNWVQTTTIEGKHAQDSWVKANEPAYFVEFGPPGPHVSIGFVKKFDNTASLGGATRTAISGQVRSIHNSRPPNFAFHTGAPVPNCWVGLNSLATGVGQGVAAQPCNEDSTFSIQNVPPGEYQLAVWDGALDYLFATKNITVDPGGTCNGGGSCNLLDVPIFAWFARLEQHVFNDTNGNGFWDDGEVGMLEQGTNIRMRDGTMYQSFPTDTTGAAPYDEVFPFFAWIVAEVNFDRFKATGATIVVDDGGPIDPTDPWSFGGVLHPQPQTVANGAPYEGAPYRTEVGPVLTQGIQQFLGQTNIIMWGKKPYGPNENGGITGIVYYAVTRAENDPQYAAAEGWEPGIPRIQVALYNDQDGDGKIDDPENDGVHIADVDNYPFGWADGTAPKGDEDYDYNGNGTFDKGDAIQVTYTDSWDDNLPTGCGETFSADGVYPVECYDGLRSFNQVRPAVFDGGYAFNNVVAGTYIVGTGEHPVYETLKEEDKNVDYGQTYTPNPNQLPPPCVGDDHIVASTYTLFNDGTPAAAGQSRKLCDRKQVILTDGKNAAADFFMFTQVPIAGHIIGFILDDTTNEFDPNAPTFGEKYAPPYMPVSIRDWTGKEISRTYSDRWGRYNALVPSTYTTNIPNPSGVSPNILTACMNDPGPLADGQIDPYYKRQYSQFCYTLQYLPGSATFLDTPVVPVAAFTGPNPNTLDCRVPEGTPVIWSATSPTVAGPYLANANDVLTIVAAQDTTTGRDMGFGAGPGQILLDGAALPASSIQSWNANIITVQIPSSGNLEIVRADGKKSETGIHVTVGGGATVVPAGGSIQAAIDSASAGDLIIVPEGNYHELVIMWKPVRLQGVGAATTITAEKVPAEKLLNWRNAVAALVSGTNPQVDLLPGQETGAGLFEPLTLASAEGPGLIVLAKQNGRNAFSRNESRFDGFNIAGSDTGGIVVNAYAHNFEISNNRIFGNSGVYSGGIRVGHPLVGEPNSNQNVRIHHNYIAENAGTLDVAAAGGGISLYTGTENYQVTHNYVCGNYTQGEGAGIGHLGLSNDGVIANNKILFNQSFVQGTTNSGGGIFIGGVPNATGLTAGSGSVTIDSNLIQGNQAGAGDGGGIRLSMVNGTDVQGPGTANHGNWYHIGIQNNMIVNNVAGLAGGAISMQDAGNVDITNNTVVNNNSTATAGDAFAPNSPNDSTPQPAGIVAHAYSDTLANAIGSTIPAQWRQFSNPTMYNNIVMDNRAFYFHIDPTQDPASFGLVAAGMSDFAVLGTTTPQSLTSLNGLTTGDATTGDLFVTPYVNTGNDQVIQQIELTTTIATQPAFDEGGNYIQVNFGPISPAGDYHLKSTASAAIDQGNTAVAPATDIDGQTRNGPADIGADEYQP